MRARRRGREERDSLGGVFEVRVLGLPPGLGGYAQADRLTARLGAALFSIPAIKGVEFGLGFESGGAARLARPRRDRAPGRRRARGGADGGASRARQPGGRPGGRDDQRGGARPARGHEAHPDAARGLPSVDFATGAGVRATYQRSDVTSVPGRQRGGGGGRHPGPGAAFLDKFGGDCLTRSDGYGPRRRGARPFLMRVFGAGGTKTARASCTRAARGSTIAASSGHGRDNRTRAAWRCQRSSIGRAPDLQSGGCGFESHRWLPPARRTGTRTRRGARVDPASAGLLPSNRDGNTMRRERCPLAALAPATSRWLVLGSIPPERTRRNLASGPPPTGRALVVNRGDSRVAKGGQTVNLMATAFTGSNPVPPTRRPLVASRPATRATRSARSLAVLPRAARA